MQIQPKKQSPKTEFNLVVDKAPDDGVSKMSTLTRHQKYLQKLSAEQLE